MSIKENFKARMQSKQIEENKQKQSVLQEAAQDYRDFRRNEVEHVSFGEQQIAYEFKVFKHVLTECIGDLYISSLVIDNPEGYEESLKESVGVTMTELMENCNSIRDVVKTFKNTSPYVKEAMVLAESIAAEKSQKLNEAAEEDKDAKPYPMEVILDADDKKLIDDFEKIEGKEDIGKAIQDRVIEVYKAEEKAGQERKEIAQSVIDDLSKNKDLNESIVLSGVNTFSPVPETIFHALYVNRSKMALNETANPDLSQSQERIVSETICMYTLLECVNALGLTNYSVLDKEKLRTQIHIQECARQSSSLNESAEIESLNRKIAYEIKCLNECFNDFILNEAAGEDGKESRWAKLKEKILYVLKMIAEKMNKVISLIKERKIKNNKNDIKKPETNITININVPSNTDGCTYLELNEKIIVHMKKCLQYINNIIDGKEVTITEEDFKSQLYQTFSIPRDIEISNSANVKDYFFTKYLGENKDMTFSTSDFDRLVNFEDSITEKMLSFVRTMQSLNADFKEAFDKILDNDNECLVILECKKIIYLFNDALIVLYFKHNDDIHKVITALMDKKSDDSETNK